MVKILFFAKRKVTPSLTVLMAAAATQASEAVKT